MYFLHPLARHALTVMAGLCALLTPVIMLTLVMSGTNVDLIGQPFMSTSAPHTAPSHSPGEALTTVGLVLGNNPAAHKGPRTQMPTADTPVRLASAVTYCGPYCDGTGGGTGTGDGGGDRGDCHYGHHSTCTGGDQRSDGSPRGQPDPPLVIVAVQPPVVQRPVVQPPAVQRPVVQPPVVQPPVVQPPVVQPPVIRPPVEPVAAPTVEPPAVPVIEAPVSSLGFFKLIPGSSPVIVALILLGIGLLAALLVLHAVRNRHGQKWMRARIQLVAGADPGVGVEVMESRTDRSPSTCVVRLEPHADSGTQIFEEVHP
jgi:hypothetical protein